MDVWSRWWREPKTGTPNAFKFRFCHKMCASFFLYCGFENFWRLCFGCRCVMWHASCVESLFPLLLGYLLCSDMFLSPSPKFPSFRERSEARDCDPPWGWVKDSPPPSLPERWAVPPLLFILYTPESLFLSWITWQCAERAAVSSFQLYFGLFRWINKCFTGGCMQSLCVDLKKGKMELFPFWQRDIERVFNHYLSQRS